MSTFERSPVESTSNLGQVVERSLPISRYQRSPTNSKVYLVQVLTNDVARDRELKLFISDVIHASLS